MKSNIEKRPTIAFLLNQFYHTYQSTIWRIVVEECRKRNANILFFVTKSLLSPYGYETQFNSIFSLVKNNKIDCIITNSAPGTFIGEKEYEKFLERFSPIPIVTFAFSSKNFPCVNIDGKSGMLDAVTHLVKFHNLRKIAFIKGIKNNVEAEDRFNAYLEGLKKFGIAIDENLICEGNYVRDSGYKAAEELLIKRKIKPEAIIAANDEMILGVLDFLKEKNISVPEEIKLVGFDDIEEAKVSTPSISTIRQPFRKQIEKAVEKAIGLINGKEVPCLTSFPTEFIARESCGCYEIYLSFEENKAKNLSPEIEKEMDLYLFKDINERGKNKNLIGFFIEYLNSCLLKNLNLSTEYKNILSYILKKKEFYKNNNVVYNFIHNIYFEFQIIYKDFEKRIAINNLLNEKEKRVYLENFTQIISTAFDYEKLIEILKIYLPVLKIKKFLLCLYRGSVEWDGSLNWKIPEKAKIVFDYRNGEEIKHKRPYILTKDFVPENFFDETLLIGAILPLFFANEQVGYFVVSPVPDDDFLLETLQKQISSAIKGAVLIEKLIKNENQLKKTLKKLKISEKKLMKLSILDELTGLYNRRGLYTIGEKFIELFRRNQRDSLLFFFDVDWLKKINDNFGHKEGDFVLKTVAEILKKTFRQSDLIARIGGDEIVVLSIDCSLKEFEKIKERLNKNLEDFNKKSKKPYKISVSYGVSMCNSNNTSIDKLIEEADLRLYERKKNRIE